MKSIITAVVFAVLPIAAAVHGADLTDAGRKIHGDFQDAVVTVKMVANFQFAAAGQSQKTESKSDAIGTVIDPSGLTVMSLAALDPSKTITDMYTARFRSAGRSVDLKVETEITDLKIVLRDGTEIPAAVALRDNDRDLAYVRPSEKQAKPLKAVSLAADARAKLLEEVIVLNRLGKVAGHTTAVSIERINALVEQPRTFYILASGQGLSGIGSPVFCADGRLLGILLIRSIPTGDDSNIGSMFSGADSLGIMPIIVPARDILDGAKQVPEPKKPGADSAP